MKITYTPNPLKCTIELDEGWEQHVPRWNAEAANALEWLKKYRDTHFKGE